MFLIVPLPNLESICGIYLLPYIRYIYIVLSICFFLSAGFLDSGGTGFEMGNGAISSDSFPLFRRSAGSPTGLIHSKGAMVHNHPCFMGEMQITQFSSTGLKACVVHASFFGLMALGFWVLGS